MKYLIAFYLIASIGFTMANPQQMNQQMQQAGQQQQQRPLAQGSRQGNVIQSQQGSHNQRLAPPAEAQNGTQPQQPQQPQQGQ